MSGVQKRMLKLSIKDSLGELGIALVKTGRLAIYKTAYAVIVILPARNKRQKEARARHFAQKVAENTDRHAPMAVAVAINGILIAIGGMVTIRSNSGNGNADAIEASVGDFFVKTTPQSEPPSGGSTAASQAALNEAANAMMAQALSTAAPTAPSMVTTTAVSPLAFEIKAPAPSGPSSEALQALNAATKATGTATAANQGAGTAQGTDSHGNEGTGGGTGRGIGQGNWDMSKTAKGNFGPGWGTRPGKDSLEKQDVILIIDQTMRTQNSPDLDPEVTAIIQTLRKNNNVLGEFNILTGIMAATTSSEKDLRATMMHARNEKNEAVSFYSDEKNVRAIWEKSTTIADRVSAYWAIRDACEKYKGKKATIVVISDFRESEQSTADVELLTKSLLEAELRLYLITTQENPKGGPTIVATQSGGSVRRVYTDFYAEVQKGNNPDSIPWADPQSRNLLRNLDPTP